MVTSYGFDMKYKLKSGQINFESQENTGAYACVVIKDGKFFNLTDELQDLLMEAIRCSKNTEDIPDKQPNGPKINNLEDMF
jgi:hypothetical protein